MEGQETLTNEDESDEMLFYSYLASFIGKHKATFGWDTAFECERIIN